MRESDEQIAGRVCRQIAHDVEDGRPASAVITCRVPARPVPDELRRVSPACLGFVSDGSARPRRISRFIESKTDVGCVMPLRIGTPGLGVTMRLPDPEPAPSLLGRLGCFIADRLRKLSGA